MLLLASAQTHWEPLSNHPPPHPKCRSESSRSEEVSSCEEEEEEDSLSPGSSFSVPRPAHCRPQLEGQAPGGLSLDGAQFLSGSPSHWSVEEVCQFISSLQGEVPIGIPGLMFDVLFNSSLRYYYIEESVSHLASGTENYHVLGPSVFFLSSVACSKM